MALIGYARVSTQDQDLSAQIEALEAAGCDRDFIYYGKQSGKSEENEQKLQEMIKQTRKGDVVLVTKLDRIARSLNKILIAIDELDKKGVAVRTLDGQVDTASDNAMQKAMTQLLGVFAELEHSIIVDRLQSGRERTGKLGGRKPKLSEDQKKAMCIEFKGGMSKSKLATKYEVSRATVMRIVDAA